MDYEKTIPFSGSTEKALEMARNIFIQQNFQIVASADSAVELTGPGMLSSRQNPLVALSSVTIHATGGSLSIEADFGAIKTLTRYLTYFILGMAIFFFVLFGLLFYEQGQPARLLIPLAPFAPWPILIPVLAKIMRRRTRRALDTLMNNISAIAVEN